MVFELRTCWHHSVMVKDGVGGDVLLLRYSYLKVKYSVEYVAM